MAQQPPPLAQRPPTLVHPRRYPGSAKLAGVKDTLYNPRLPTLRKMDRDDAMSKLPFEHCRTTTTCSKEEFERMKTSLRTEGGPSIQFKFSQHASSPVNMKDKPLVNTNSHTDNWQQILNKMNTSPDGRPRLTDAITWHNKLNALGYQGCGGLFMRKKQPDITSSWQYVRPATGRPGALDWANTRATRPLPATLYTRYKRLESLGSQPAWK